MESKGFTVNNNSELLDNIQNKQLELQEEIDSITYDINDIRSILSSLNSEKVALENEKPKVLLFFGGDRSESDIEKDKEENRKKIEENENLIKEKEAKLKELKNSLNTAIKEMNDVYSKQLQSLSNDRDLLKNSLEKQEKESEKQKEELLNSFKEENEKLKNTIEQQKKIIEEMDEEQNELEDDELDDEEDRTLSDKELRDLAIETIKYFNSVPQIVERNGGYYTEQEIGMIEDFLIENDLDSIQSVKDRLNRSLRMALSFHDDDENYEDKDTGELIKELDVKNNNLIERVRKNDTEAIEKYQNILSKIKDEIDKKNVFIKILMWFGYDYGNLKTSKSIIKERLKRKREDIVRNEKGMLKEREKYEKEMTGAISNKLKQEQEEISSNLYEAYSGLDVSNLEPNTSLKEKQREEGFSLV